MLAYNFNGCPNNEHQDGDQEEKKAFGFRLLALGFALQVEPGRVRVRLEQYQVGNMGWGSFHVSDG